jgi:exodeoxyribonuclease V alpha subunit
MILTATYGGYHYCERPDEHGLVGGVFLFTNRENGNFIATGSIPYAMQYTGLQLSISGEWTDSEHGRRFRIDNITTVAPDGRNSSLVFLQMAYGIDQTTAESLWNEHREQVVTAAAEAARTLQEASRRPAKKWKPFTPEKRIAKFLRTSLSGIEGRPALVALLANCGFPQATIERVLELQLADPVLATATNPYWLLRFAGVSLSHCDNLRAKIGLQRNMPQRGQAGVLLVLERATNEIWLHADSLACDVAALLHARIENSVLHINQCVSNGTVTRSGRYVALASAAVEERALTKQLWSRRWATKTRQAAAGLIRVTIPRKVTWPNMAVIGLTRHQAIELNRAFKNGPTAFLLGAANTGTTTCAAAVIKHFSRIVACAPTEHAASQLTEAMQRRHIGAKATTIHQLLQATQTSEGPWTWSPISIKADLVVVDGCSELTNELALALLQATHLTTRILFVGDPDQLPLIGRGALLRDWRSLCGEDFSYKAGILTADHHDCEGVVLATNKTPGDALRTADFWNRRTMFTRLLERPNEPRGE